MRSIAGIALRKAKLGSLLLYQWQESESHDSGYWSSAAHTKPAKDRGLH